MNVKMVNRVIATIRDEHGNTTHVQEGFNTVTDGSPPDPGVLDNGRFLILERMFDNGEIYDPDDFVNKIDLGTGTPGDSGLGTPISKVKTLAVQGSIDVSTPAAPVITVRGSWTAGDGALSGITEAGLFADGTDTTLFAYKTFSPALSKTAGGTLDIDWEVTIS